MSESSAGPRVVTDAGGRLPSETCLGCGTAYERATPAQSRCPACIMAILGILDDMPTATLMSLVQEAVGTDQTLRAVRLDQVVATLNELLSIDARAMSELVRQRVRVNAGIIHHPSAKTRQAGDGHFYIGMIGILNAMFRSSGLGAVSVKQNADGVGPVLGFLSLDDPGIANADDTE